MGRFLQGAAELAPQSTTVTTVPRPSNTREAFQVQMRTLSALMTALKDDTGCQVILPIWKTHSNNKDTFKREVDSNKTSLKFGFFPKAIQPLL